MDFTVKSFLTTATNLGSFGIRKLSIVFSTNPAVSSLCGKAGFINLYDIENCVCSLGFYNYNPPNTGCEKCHENCASCYGPTSFDCYECNDGSYFDGTSCVACDSSCLKCSGPNAGQCESCASGYILFYGACIASSRCKSPFTFDLCSNSCFSPCDSQDISNWDKSCIPACQTQAIQDHYGNCKGNFFSYYFYDLYS